VNDDRKSWAGDLGAGGAPARQGESMKSLGQRAVVAGAGAEHDRKKPSAVVGLVAEDADDDQRTSCRRG
jgi:hypothetical protein